MSDSLCADAIHILGNGNDEIEAYLAQPKEDSRRGGVIVIHHMAGYDRATKEVTRRFAVLGYDALCVNLFCRYAPGADPDDAAAAARAKGGVPDEQLIGDVAGAAAALRALSTSNGKVGVIGYCSGGRQSVLAACNVDLDAAVDCYGAYVTGTPPEGFPISANIVDHLPRLGAPLLGLFGADDQFPSPSDVEELRTILMKNNKSFEFHTYENAGHAFFGTDRPHFRVEAANEGWERVAEFFAKYLGK